MNFNNRKLVRLHRTTLRQTNVFDILQEAEFKANFRFGKEICQYLVDLIKPHMSGRERSSGLTKQVRILCALRYFATGK